jgi:hypothetical protein
MRFVVIGLGFALAIVLAAMAMSADNSDSAIKPLSPMQNFDHEEHEGLKVECDTCHIKRGAPELRDQACAECHEQREPCAALCNESV